MPRHVLIVDAVATNRIVLKVKLTAAFYDVDQARSGAEALQRISAEAPTMILVGSLDDMTPEDFCKHLKSNADTAHIAIILIAGSSLDGLRIRALDAGADDVIEKPFDEAILLARLRSLQRAHDAAAELQLRDATHQALGLSDAPQAAFDKAGRITIVTDDVAGFAAHLRDLRTTLPHRIELRDPRSFLRKSSNPRAREQAADVYLLALSEETAETELQILPELRSRDTTREASLLVQIPENRRPLIAAALDLGADDVIDTSAGLDEIALRLDRLIRRKQKADRLRNTVRDGLRAAVTDPLTGLHNRRFALPHLGRVAEQSRRSNRPFAVMVADLDHFKRINDSYGHAAGDAVLREVARRFKAHLRPLDLVARIGGEEFLIVLPDISGRVAQRTAHRLCEAIAETGFIIPGHSAPIRVTISIGLTTEQCGQRAAPQYSEELSGPLEQLHPNTLISRADRALFGAKAHGRNQVEFSRPAA